MPISLLRHQSKFHGAIIVFPWSRKRESVFGKAMRAPAGRKSDLPGESAKRAHGCVRSVSRFLSIPYKSDFLPADAHLTKKKKKKQF